MAERMGLTGVLAPKVCKVNTPVRPILSATV